jgi:hypothetical protein
VLRDELKGYDKLARNEGKDKSKKHRDLSSVSSFALVPLDNPIRYFGETFDNANLLYTWLL